MSHENANTSSLTDSEHLSAPTITYVEAGQTNELVSLDELFEGLFPRDARPPPLPLRALFPFLFARQRTLLRRPCRCCDAAARGSGNHLRPTPDGSAGKSSPSSMLCRSFVGREPQASTAALCSPTSKASRGWTALEH